MSSLPKRDICSSDWSQWNKSHSHILLFSHWAFIWAHQYIRTQFRFWNHKQRTWWTADFALITTSQLPCHQKAWECVPSAPCRRQTAHYSHAADAEFLISDALPLSDWLSTLLPTRLAPGWSSHVRHRSRHALSTVSAQQEPSPGTPGGSAWKGNMRCPVWDPLLNAFQAAISSNRRGNKNQTCFSWNFITFSRWKHDIRVELQTKPATIAAQISGRHKFKLFTASTSLTFSFAFFW